jgi:predicted S18 family serine protease
MDKMYDDIELAETKSRYSKMRHYREIIGSRMQLIADITEVREKIENLIKITEDIYYAKVYQTTLKVLRSEQWTASLNGKLEVIQQNYSLLSNEVNIQHSHFLEWIIIVLIALEFAFFILETII